MLFAQFEKSQYVEFDLFDKVPLCVIIGFYIV